MAVLPSVWLKRKKLSFFYGLLHSQLMTANLDTAPRVLRFSAANAPLQHCVCPAAVGCVLCSRDKIQEQK